MAEKLSKTVLFPIAIFAVAFLLRLAHFVQFDTWDFLSNSSTDEFMHFQIGMNLVHHGGFFFGGTEWRNFTDFSGTAVSFYVAAFLWLKGVFPGIYWAKLGLLSVGAMSSVLVYLLCLQIFRNRWGALAAGLLLGIHPVSIAETPLIMNDTLALFFFLITANFFVRCLRSEEILTAFFFVGVLAGVTAMARYAYVSLFGVIFLTLLLRPKKFRLERLALLSLGFLLTFGNWMIRNWLIKKGLSPSEMVGSLVEYAAPFLTGELPQDNRASFVLARYGNFLLNFANPMLFLLAVVGIAAWGWRYRESRGALPLLLFAVIYPIILVVRCNLHARYRLPVIASYCVFSGAAVALLMDFARSFRFFTRAEKWAAATIPILCVSLVLTQTVPVFARVRTSTKRLHWAGSVANSNSVILTPHARNPWRILELTGRPVISYLELTPFLVEKIPCGAEYVPELWHQNSIENYLAAEVFGKGKRAYVLREDYLDLLRTLNGQQGRKSPLFKNPRYQLRLAVQDPQKPRLQLYELIRTDLSRVES